MNETAITFHARGMHCHGCEHVIEAAVRKLAGVRSVSASYPTETVVVDYDADATNFSAIRNSVEQNGYRVVLTEEAQRRRSPFIRLAIIVAALAGLAGFNSVRYALDQRRGRARHRSAYESRPPVSLGPADRFSLRRHVRRLRRELCGGRRAGGALVLRLASRLWRGKDAFLHDDRRRLRLARRLHRVHAHAARRRGSRGGRFPPHLRAQYAWALRAAAPLSARTARPAAELGESRGGRTPSAIRDRSSQRSDDRLRTVAGDVCDGGGDRQPRRRREDALRLRPWHFAGDARLRRADDSALGGGDASPADRVGRDRRRARRGDDQSRIDPHGLGRRSRVADDGLAKPGAR